MEIKIKMNKTAIIVSSVVGSLGLLAAILGFSAEGANSTNPSPGLGICAGIFLLAAQVTVSAVSGCGCCKSRAIPSETKRVVGIVCAVGSWIAAVIAFVLFVEGAAVNANGYYVKGGIYAGAGVLALAATALGITSFVMLRSPPADAPSSKPAVQQPVQGIPVMVHPQPHYTQSSTAESAHQPDNHRQDQLPPTSPHHAPAQSNGRPAPPIQQFSPQGHPADMAPPAATTNVPKPAEQLQTPTAGVPIGQSQFPPAQAYVQPQVVNGTLQQYPVEAPQVGVDIPVAPPVLSADSPFGNVLPPTAPPAAPAQGTGLSTVIRNELTRATIRLAGKAAEHALFGDYTVTTDPTGAGVGATDCGDSAV